ncbi:fetuin-B-like precursor [Callorhinchus milii]|uniref:Alpha-2-HS-glycoprotein n=1 Tax=Callorhinchus milii TaxID=7868 RepID=K4FT29_CALMI|nr:fetuin-B-like precursor [Callorhinchus milii]AFK11293.1 alpha-2-HS-glycoprotein [Callorhinchus milii]
MKLLSVLVLGTQIFHCLSAVAQGQQPSYRALSCNALRVVAAADLAVEQMNAERSGGYKYILNKIENAQEKRGKGGSSSLFLEFEVLETRCHSLNPKPASECQIRSGREANSGDCKVKLQMNSTRKDHVQSYRCLISPDSDDMILRRCPGCPYRIPLNNTDATHSVMIALQKYNRKSNRTNYFALHEITKASSQIVAGKNVFVEFAIQETACSKASQRPDCQAGLGALKSTHTGLCTASVYMPIFGKEKIEVNCELYEPQVVANTRKSVNKGGIKRGRTKEKGRVSRSRRQSPSHKGQPHVKKQPRGRAATTRRIESSEEVQGSFGFVIGTGGTNGNSQSQTFPILPPPRTACPGRARYTRPGFQPI